MRTHQLGSLNTRDDPLVLMTSLFALPNIFIVFDRSSEKEMAKRATVEFVPMSNGDLAETVDVN
jgi:hypothetical protein